MVFSLEHDIKVTKIHQNLLPTQSVLVAHTVVISHDSRQQESSFLDKRNEFGDSSKNELF
jgi:hypothetical protein